MSRREAVRRAFARHHRALTVFLRARMGGDTDVADAVQEVFLRLSAQECSDAVREYPRSYVLKTAHSVLVDFQRRQRARRRDDHCALNEDLMTSSLGEPDRILESKEVRDALRDAIQELAPKCRKVFLLHRFQSRTYSEIAAEQGISVSMVETYITRALRVCRTKIEAHLGESDEE